MLKNLKEFLRHSVVYSISNAAAKAVGIILLPLYTSYITVAEFGALALIEISLAIAVELLLFGQGQSILMFNDASYKGKSKSIFYTIFIFLLTTNLLFILLLNFALLFIPDSLLGAEYVYYIRLASGILLFRIMNLFILDKLRAEENSVVYTFYSLSKLITILSLTIFFVAYSGLKIEGILYAHLIGEFVLVVFGSAYALRFMERIFSFSILKVSFRFGYPLIITSIAFLVLNLSDRYIINEFWNTAAVGLYDLGYRVAGVLNMFIIMPFTLTLMPAAYRMYQQPGDKRYYSKLMTYYTFLLTWGGLGLSLFSREIIMLFAQNESYYPAYLIVPVIVIAYIFSGIRQIAVLGQLLTRKTTSIAVSTFLAALLNIGLNIALIPIYGYTIAAYTTLISFIFLFIVSLLISGKYYYIPFEYRKIAMVLLLGTALFISSLLLRDVSLFFSILFKGGIIIIFPFILYAFKFYEDVEITTMKSFISKFILRRS